MPKRITISPHLSINELEQRYRQAKTVTERVRYPILWLFAQGKVSEEVAGVTGYSRSWIYADNELSALTRQCLSRHIADQET